MMRIVNEKPRPRALFLGFEPEEIERLENFFPTARRIVHLGEVRQGEWDVLLTKFGVSGLEPHMYVLSFGGDMVDGLRPLLKLEGDDDLLVLYDKSETSLAAEFVLPDGLEPGVLRLVERDVLPKLKARSSHVCLSVGRWYGMQGVQFARGLEDVLESRLLKFQLFVGTSEPKALAGCFVRAGGKSETWMLPFSDLDVGAWVELALRQWHKMDPEKFPVNLGWERSREWMTPAESDIDSRIEAVRKERQETVARLDILERELKAQFHDASILADSKERLLLTAQGETLVQAVFDALVELGFHVQDMDKVFPSRDRREDLRVRLSEEGPWVAICEVKGYFKGAQVNDLLKMERFRGRFFKETGRDPERCWYVVNHHSKESPSERGSPLPMNAEEVATFSEGGGVVLSTVNLFQLVMNVRRGDMSTQTARDLLVNSTGLLSLGGKNGNQVA